METKNIYKEMDLTDSEKQILDSIEPNYVNIKGLPNFSFLYTQDLKNLSISERKSYFKHINSIKNLLITKDMKREYTSGLDVNFLRRIVYSNISKKIESLRETLKDLNNVALLNCFDFGKSWEVINDDALNFKQFYGYSANLFQKAFSLLRKIETFDFTRFDLEDRIYNLKLKALFQEKRISNNRLASPFLSAILRKYFALSYGVLKLEKGKLIFEHEHEGTFRTINLPTNPDKLFIVLEKSLRKIEKGEVLEYEPINKQGTPNNEENPQEVKLKSLTVLGQISLE